MKLLTLILSVYIFSVSLMPCTDLHSHSDAEETHVHAEHNHNEEHQDTCAPFCVCACCGVFVTVPTFISFLETEQIIQSIQNSFYSFNYSFDFCKGTWHPPTFS